MGFRAGCMCDWCVEVRMWFINSKSAQDCRDALTRSTLLFPENKQWRTEAYLCGIRPANYPVPAPYYTAELINDFKEDMQFTVCLHKGCGVLQVIGNPVLVVNPADECPNFGMNTGG